MNRGQTLDSAHSFVIVNCDDASTLMLFGHVYQTNQISARLHLYYKLDGGAPIDTGVFFTTGADGTADFAFSIKGIPPGSHTATIEINFTAPELTYYVYQAAINDAQTGIPFTSPGSPSQLQGQPLVPWAGMNKGQTLDSTHSFATAQCDSTGTLTLFGHLSQTNQLSAPFFLAPKLDGGAPIHNQGASFTTNADGTGDFALSIKGITSGVHSVVPEVNFGSYPGYTYYVNQTAINDAQTGIPYTCP
jgi:hypothetical protein